MGSFSPLDGHLCGRGESGTIFVGLKGGITKCDVIMEIKDYVMPIVRRAGDERSFAGTAFCIHGQLVTAAHVLDWGRTLFVRNGEDYHPLQHIMWQPRQVQAEDRMGFDVAFYGLRDMASPLSLSDKDAEKNDELEVLCWQLVGGKLQQVHTSCIVRGEDNEDGYQMISTAARITHGASGCPVFKDGKVYGILTMGRDFFEMPSGGFMGIPRQHQGLMQRMEENTCFIFKTSHIRRFLPEDYRWR